MQITLLAALLQPQLALVVTPLAPQPPAFAAAARHAPVVAGGFEQKYFSKDGARLALLVSESPEVSTIKGLCAESGASGVIYELNSGRLEIVAEADRDTLEQLAKSIEASAGDAKLREAWQAPVGGYTTSFPIVELKPKMGAKITLEGNGQDLDYITTHLQVEAVFNRGLTLKKARDSDSTLTLDVKGQSARLKSFVRWCYNGPPLVRPERVTVDWKEA